jgi:hypothetical protein
MKNNDFIKELNKYIDKDRNSGYWRDNALIFRVYMEDNSLECKFILESATHKNQVLLEELREKIFKVSGIKSKNDSE